MSEKKRSIANEFPSSYIQLFIIEEIKIVKNWYTSTMAAKFRTKIQQIGEASKHILKRSEK